MFKVVGYYLQEGDSETTPVKEMRPGTPWRGQPLAVPHRILWLLALEGVAVPIKK